MQERKRCYATQERTILAPAVRRTTTFHRLAFVILDFFYERLLRLLVHAVINHVGVGLRHAASARRLTEKLFSGQSPDGEGNLPTLFGLRYDVRCSSWQR